jgi:WD40 repeat protein
VKFHPTSSGLLASTSGSSVAIWDVESGAGGKAIDTTVDKGVWGLEWGSVCIAFSNVSSISNLFRLIRTVEPCLQLAKMEFSNSGTLECPISIQSRCVSRLTCLTPHH